MPFCSAMSASDPKRTFWRRTGHLCRQSACAAKISASRLIVVVRVRTTPFYGITHIAEYKDRESYHALPLFRTKRFIEWLPRLSEFIQID